jgi:zinc/manganese transport system substrate-binding protein
VTGLRCAPLVGPNGDTHIYEPTPADVRALANAAIVFEIGLGFESWLPNLYRASRSRAVRVTVTDGMSLLRAGEGGHRHGEWDPHVWHDVANAVHITHAVRDALRAADLAGWDYYSLNAAVYAGYLWELDAWIYEQVVCCTTEAGRNLVTLHASFNYLAARYGFLTLTTALDSISTEAEPSARRVATVVDRIREHGVRAIFPENIGDRRLMERIAAEAGVTLAPPLYSDALGPPDHPAGTYYGMMTYNINTIIRALS